MNLPNILYESFRKEEKEPKAQGSITFAPSYLSNCVRQTYYKKIGEKPSNPIDLPAMLKMQFGTVIHDEIQSRLQDKGILKSFEQWRTKEHLGLTFHYFYDGILEQDGERAIMEIKTVYANGFNSVEKEPKSDHVLQTLSYMIFEDINDAIILYAGRDNGYLLQYNLRLADIPEIGKRLLINNQRTDYLEKWNDRVKKMHQVKKNIEEKQLPQREFSIVLKNSSGAILDSFQKDNVKHKSAWQCSYCPFKELCWKKELEEIKTKKFFINGQFI